MATPKTQPKAGNPIIDGLLGGTKWDGVVTFGFPDVAADYPANYGPEPDADFFPISSEQQRVARLVFEQVEAFTKLEFSYAGKQTADIAFGQSSYPETAFAYEPFSGGDVWFGSANNYRTPRVGDISYATHFHEIGHALGLKHPHEGSDTMPAYQDWLAYSVMSYRSYVNAPLTGYTSQTFSFPTTFMPADIAALQTMYGADFSLNRTSTTYSWSPLTGQFFVNGEGQAIPGSGTGVVGDPSSNRIFMAVWDGGGNDTYDTSNYSSNQSVNLLPGEGSTFWAEQRPQLDTNQYGQNVYNALLYNDNPASLIENAKTGDGADTIRGNPADNRLNGGAGSDTLFGYVGDDTLIGGLGSDLLYGSVGGDSAVFDCKYADALITFYPDGTCLVGVPGGADRLYFVEYLKFKDVTVEVSDFRPVDTEGPQIREAGSNSGDNAVINSSNVVIPFDGVVLPGSGKIHIYYEDGTLYGSYAASQLGYSQFDTSPLRYIESSVFHFDIPDDPGGYYFEIDPDFVVDSSGNSFEGLSGRYSWNFWIGKVDDFPNQFNSVTSGKLNVGALPQVGYLNNQEDTDTFKVQLTEGQIYKFTANTPGPNPADGFSLMVTWPNVIYDPPYSGATPSGSIPDGDTLYFLAPKTGEYQFSIGPYPYYNPDGSDFKPGDYSLQVAAVSDEFAAVNDTKGKVEVGDSLAGIIHHAQDVDYIKVNLVAGQSYRFDIVSGSDSPADDGIEGPRFSLLRADGSVAVYPTVDDDRIAEKITQAQFAYTAEATATYYIAVTGSSADSGRPLTTTGSYTVSVAEGNFPPPTLISTSPADEANGVAPDADIVFTFDSAIRRGSGLIQFYDTQGGYFLGSIDVADTSQVRFEASRMIVNPSTLRWSGGVTVALGAGVVEAVDGTDFGGTSFNFIGGEPAADITTTATIADGQTIADSFDPGDDHNWYRIELVAGERYDIRMIAGTSTSPWLPDPQATSFSSSLAIRDAAGNLIVEDAANSAGGANARILFTAPTTGTYFIDLAGSYYYIGYRSFAYQLQVTGAPGIVKTGTGSVETILGTSDNDLLNGAGGNDRIEGDRRDDILKGGGGNDVLIGGAGADKMIGGPGNDIFNVDDAGDAVVELVGEGYDEVRTGLSAYTLAPEIESLVGTFGGGATLTGNAAANRISGGSGGDMIDGAASADRMQGGFGDDTYIVDDDGDQVVELTGRGLDTVLSAVSYKLAGAVERLILTGNSAIDGIGNGLANELVGNDAANRLTGGGGNDLLDGGDGADEMLGGAGDDRFFVDDPGDRVIEGVAEGTDSVESVVDFVLSDNVENLVLTGNGDVDGTGNGRANVLTGNDGDNRLDGGAGADRMAGGAGNDIYVVDAAGDEVTEAPGGGMDIVESSVGFTLGADVEKLTLTGTKAANGTGNELANRLLGNSSANVLDGRGGVDTMKGGDGDDTYVVDHVRDRVEEVRAAGGTDLIKSSITFRLGTHFENLTLTGPAAINGVGNSLANVITGNAAANFLNGGAGADTLSGGGGKDTYIVDNAGDRVVETSATGGFDTVKSSVAFELGANVENLILTGSGAIGGRGNGLGNRIEGNAAGNSVSGLDGDDILSGGGSADKLYGGAGKDLLDGGTGKDRMTGGGGNDVYMVDNVGDAAIETSSAAGVDRVESSVSFRLGNHVEQLTLTGTTAIDGTGNGLANILTGNAAANVLNGAGGADTMIGGRGNDTYVVAQGADKVVEASATGGSDTVRSSVDFVLGANLEKLVLTGTGAIDGTGNGLANAITGNAAANRLGGASGADTLRGGGGRDVIEGGRGSDLLDGGGGADTMSGGKGDDLFIVNDIADKAIEVGADDGLDEVRSSVSFTLGANVEKLTLTGAGATSGTGNVLGNTIVGNDGANSLKGLEGADRLEGGRSADDLRGGSAADVLDGGLGIDALFGGKGNDRLIGGDGADSFHFDTDLDGVRNVDRIADFVAADDTIRIDRSIFGGIGGGTLAVEAFRIGSAAADSDDRILYDSGSGSIYYDADGIGGAAAILFAQVNAGTALTHADFVGYI